MKSEQYKELKDLTVLPLKRTSEFTQAQSSQQIKINSSGTHSKGHIFVPSPDTNAAVSGIVFLLYLRPDFCIFSPTFAYLHNVFSFIFPSPKPVISIFFRIFFSLLKQYRKGKDAKIYSPVAALPLLCSMVQTAVTIRPFAYSTG